MSRTKKQLQQEVLNWTDTAAQYARNADYWRGRTESAEKAIDAAIHELGVPQPGYPAPVVNAVEALRAHGGSSEPVEP